MMKLKLNKSLTKSKSDPCKSNFKIFITVFKAVNHEKEDTSKLKLIIKEL